MENAVNALKIAAAVLVFVIALTIAFTLLSQAKSTSDIILFSSDKTNYYDYSNADSEEGRIVEADVVISSLYRYYKESIVVKIYDNSNNILGEFNTKTDGLGSQKARKERVEKWIKDNSSKLEGSFVETFDEVKESGEYIKEDDGSELTMKSGQTTIWITYTKQ